MATITMTRRGNIRIDGVKHKAVPGASCHGCVLANVNCGGAVCCPSSRHEHPEYKHQRSVIFVKKGKRESSPE